MKMVAPHLHTFARIAPCVVAATAQRALGAIHSPATAATCKSRRPPSPMPRPAATARVSALAYPGHRGRHERSPTVT